MPIVLKEGNLLHYSDINVLAHCCNIWHNMGAGIAKEIREIYPKAYKADCETSKGDFDKIGTYSVSEVKDGYFVLNCYCMRKMGQTDGNLSYDAVFQVFQEIEQKAKDTLTTSYACRVGIPYGFGCSLAGGRWTIVMAILEEIFKDSPVELHIVKLPNHTKVT